MNKFKLFLNVALGLVLFGCGSSTPGPTYSVAGNSPISVNTCTPYLVTRSANVSVETLLIVGWPTGSNFTGGIYSDSSCSTIAALNLKIASGSNSLTFYFKPTSTGFIDLQVTDATNSIPIAASITVQVQ